MRCQKADPLALFAAVLAGCALVASVFILLAIATAAPARTADTRQPVAHNRPAPTVVRETVVQPDHEGPNTSTLVLIGMGAAAALLGAGYLGARIALRTSGASHTTAAPATSSTPMARGQASQTGI